jgi:hypothetical protein
VGRYTQVDPRLAENPTSDFGNCGGTRACAHLPYAYVGNDPLVFTDPTGLYRVENCGLAEELMIDLSISKLIGALPGCMRCRELENARKWLRSPDTVIRCQGGAHVRLMET